MLWRTLLWAWLGCLAALPVAAAEHEEPASAEAADEHGEKKEGEAEAPAAIYVPLKPPFIVNYGGPGRLRYIKADISVRLKNEAAANSVRHHMPYIRNNLVMLFSAQTEESVVSQEGKEALRREALQEVRNILLQEDNQEGVIDLYFNVFLTQR